MADSSFSDTDFQNIHSTGWELTNKNLFHDAVDAFKISLLTRKDWNSYRGLGWAYIKIDKYHDAIDAFTDSLALQENWNTYLGLGSALFRIHKYSEAIIAFNKSLKLNPNWDTYRGLAWSLFKTNEYSAAVQAFRNTVSLYPNPDSYRGLGWACYHNNQFDEAISGFRESLHMQDNSDSFRGLATALFKTKKYAQSIDAYNKSLKLQESADTYRCLGWAYIKNNQSLEAINSFNKSLSIQKDWDTYRGLGWALYYTYQYEKSIAAFRDSLDLEQTWDAFQSLGSVLFKRNNIIEAIQAFKKSLLLYENWDTYQSLGWAFLKNNQFSDAVDSFNRSLELDKNTDSYRGLGWALINSKEYTQASKAFNISLSYEDNADSYRGLGWSLFHNEKYLESINAFSSSLSIHKSSDTYLGLGYSLFFLGEYSESLQAMNLASTYSLDKKLLDRILTCIFKLYPTDYNLILDIIDLPEYSLKASNTQELLKNTSPYLSRINEILSTGSINPWILYFYYIKSNLLTNKKSFFKSPSSTKSDNKSTDNNIITYNNRLECCSENVLSFGGTQGDIFNGIDNIIHYSIPLAVSNNISVQVEPQFITSINHILNDYLSDDTTLIFNLGDTDIKDFIFQESRKQNRIPELLVLDIIKAYFDFIDEFIKRRYNIIIQGPYSDSKDSIYANENDKNEICLYMNQLLSIECSKRNIKFVTLFDCLVDIRTRSNLKRFFVDDQSIYPPNSLVGKELQSILLQRLNDQFSLESHLPKKNALDINSYLRVVVSNIPGLNSFSYLYTSTDLDNKSVLSSNYQYCALFQIPFYILIRNISFTFIAETLDIDLSCFAIYEACDPQKIPYKNVFKGDVTKESNLNRGRIKVNVDFDHNHSENMHSRYFFVSISQAKNAMFEQISVSRSYYST